MINGLSELALTKADVLNEFQSLEVCVAYDVDGERTEVFPIDALDRAKPIYEELSGWKDASRPDEELEEYTRRIQELTGVPVKMISYGPERDQIRMV